MNKPLETKPLLSVIIVVYNTEKYVRRCLSSIMRQTYKELEIIVVNNGSKGNIEEIIQEYGKYYPSRKIILTCLKENIGLYHARMHGVKFASGRYIAFVDSDDCLSVDYYRPMVAHAESGNYDMVANDFVDEYEDSHLCMRYNLETLSHDHISLSGHSVLEHLLEHEGHIFGWIVVWNKIYRRSLWERALADIQQFKHKQVINEDVIFSTILFYYAASFSNIHSGEYYYLRRSSAYSSNRKPLSALKKDMDDLGASFEFLDAFLKNRVNCKRCTYFYTQLKLRYMRLWIGSLESTPLSKRDKRTGLIYLQKAMRCDLSALPDRQDNFFYSIYTLLPPWQEQLRSAVADAKYKRISFAASNVLISRPFISNEDFYDYLGKKLEMEFGLLPSATFSAVRKECQVIAERELNSTRSITIRDIYDRFTSYGVSKKAAEILLNRECELFISTARRRDSGIQLFELAKAVGKEIYILEDSIYPTAVWEDIFKKCSIFGYAHNYVSSDMGVSKWDGGLFRLVASPDASPFYHVGCDYTSDILQCTKSGGDAQIFPPACQLLFGENPAIFTGHAMRRTYGNRWDCMQYSAVQRRLWAIQAQLCFDDPLVSYNADSDYDADPYRMGVMLIAPLVLAYLTYVRRLSCALRLSSSIPGKSILGRMVQQAIPDMIPAHGDGLLCLDRDKTFVDGEQFPFFEIVLPQIPPEGCAFVRKVILWEETLESSFGEKYILRALYRGISDVINCYFEAEDLMSDQQLDQPGKMYLDFLSYGTSLDKSLFHIKLESEQLLEKDLDQTDGDIELRDIPVQWGKMRRFLYYALYDRKNLKNKVKKRLEHTPALLHFSSAGYRTIRTIWHGFTAHFRR